ncbi:alpha/beta fold hydrolase [Gemmatimonas sp.]|uniref:alpha/beta fold hydrolase n=1 Tax=Gemmatimonas sp. TaxID=1962908 RepID=UPI003F6F5FB2
MHVATGSYRRPRWRRAFSRWSGATSLTRSAPSSVCWRSTILVLACRSVPKAWRTPPRRAIRPCDRKSTKQSAAFFDDLYATRQSLASVLTNVVWGMKDGTLPPSILDGWRVALPHAAVHPFEESGHWPHEEEPERFTALVRSILAS